MRIYRAEVAPLLLALVHCLHTRAHIRWKIFTKMNYTYTGSVIIKGSYLLLYIITEFAVLFLCSISFLEELCTAKMCLYSLCGYKAKKINNYVSNLLYAFVLTCPCAFILQKLDFCFFCFFVCFFLLILHYFMF